jgi:ArsR family transcriptional regulator
MPMQFLVQFGGAIADQTRWRIIQLLSHEAMCVCELADILRMPQSSVSSHLQVIRQAGMLDSERCEKWIYYRLLPEFRPIIDRLAARFRSTASTNAVLARDARASRIRLAQRERSCCPGPRKLAPRRGRGIAAVPPSPFHQPTVKTKI